MATHTARTPLKTIHSAELIALAKTPGPCVTLQVPDFHPGSKSGLRQSHCKNLLEKARQRSDVLQIGDRTKLQAALEELVSSIDTEVGGPGLTIFCSIDKQAIYETPGVDAELVAVSERFHVLPILPAALMVSEFFVLGLSKKAVRLIQYRQGKCQELPLPPKVPSSLEAAEAFDEPDHDLQNRSSAGKSVGAMGGVKFGTGTDRESAPQYLHHFFRSVDEGLRPVVRDAPILLMGVHEELAEYRRASHHNNFFEAELHGNHLSLDEIAKHAREAAMERLCQSAEAVLAVYRRENPVLAPPGIAAVLKAAIEGRVGRLIVAEGARVPAEISGEAFFAGEDLVNAAVVETLRTGGEVFVCRGNELPGIGAVAALLRY